MGNLLHQNPIAKSWGTLVLTELPHKQEYRRPALSLPKNLQARLRMVRFFDRGKEREEIAHSGIGKMLPEKPPKA